MPSERSIDCIGARGRQAPVVLAIESSTALLGVSIVAGEDVLFEESVVEPMGHSTMLLPLCLKALQATDVGPGGLSAVAVSAGPGSFTGLRIGCATAQGLARAYHTDVILVPTFRVLLQQCAQYPLVALVQGRAKAQTVTALYARKPQNGPHCEKQGEGSRTAWEFAVACGYDEVVPVAARSLEDFLACVCTASSGTVHTAGDAADLFSECCRGRCGEASSQPDVLPIEAGQRLPSPAIVGRVASRLFREGMTVRPAEAIPRYYRKSQAETLFTSRSPSRAGEGGGDGSDGPN